MPQLVYNLCGTFHDVSNNTRDHFVQKFDISESQGIILFSAYEVEIPPETENITRRETTLPNEYKNQKNLLINLLCTHISNNAHELQRQFTM